MTNANLIQCECGGWMSPRAIYCPTCGGPVAAPENPKSSLGWRVVRMFWGGVVVAVVLLIFVR